MTNPIAEPYVDNAEGDADSRYVEVDATPEGFVTVTINRRQKQNAFDSEVILALRETFETLGSQDGVRVVFLRGHGGVFSAGADLEWMREAIEHTEDDNRADAMDLAQMIKNLHDIPALTVALVEGGAYGGGVGLVAACDMAVASQDAVFALSEVKLGLVAAVISPYVVAAIGPRKARRLMATAETFGADVAREIGLVDEVVADGSALMVARDRIAAAQLACGPLAVAASKRLVDEVAGKHIDHGVLTHTAHVIAAARVSDEGQEGVRAFLERRKPSWLES